VCYESLLSFDRRRKNLPPYKHEFGSLSSGELVCKKLRIIFLSLNGDHDIYGCSSDFKALANLLMITLLLEYAICTMIQNIKIEREK